MFGRTSELFTSLYTGSCEPTTGETLNKRDCGSTALLGTDRATIAELARGSEKAAWRKREAIMAIGGGDGSVQRQALRYHSQ
eukprot:2016032-Rhodomonas_salina.1